MSEIEIDIQGEDNGGDVYLTLIRGTERFFAILDAHAADLLRDILVHRRQGIYEFGPLDMNG